MKIKIYSKLLPLIILPALLFSFYPGVAVGDSEATYTIKKGDTLWDISGARLNNPFLWSALWEKNKYIKNPDLIFPGDKLVIPGVETISDKTGETAGHDEHHEIDEIDEIPEEGEKPMETPAPIPGPPLPEEIEVPESIRSSSFYSSLKPVSVKGETGNVSPLQTPEPLISEELVFKGGYIADKVSSAGTILISPDDRNVFAAGDTVNILFKKKENAAVGDKFAIIRRPKALINSETGKPYGMLSVPIGVIEIYRIQGKDAGGRIVKSYDFISEGDMIQRLHPSAPVTAFVRPPKEAKGRIIGLREETVLASQRNIVYLDRGTKNGLTPGMILNVSGEGSNNIIGELIIISVQSSTSTALVTKSTEPFGVGSLFFVSP